MKEKDEYMKKSLQAEQMRKFIHFLAMLKGRNPVELKKELVAKLIARENENRKNQQNQNKPE